MKTIESGDVIIASYGWNDILDKPFEFKYEFGYYTHNGCIVYNQGECNMQDSHAFRLEQVRLATQEDMDRYFWGR